MDKKKMFAVLLVIILLINMILLGFRAVSFTIFWLILLIAGFVAYVLMPKLKEK